MAWPNPDLDGVRFNQDDAGWTEMESIFTAIKERAVATGHSLATGDYSGTFAMELWHADPDGDTDRDYLKDLYEQFYDDLELLVAGDVDIRWTEASGDTTEYTMASLVTATALGDFVDTLTRAANPEPILWLRAALELLIYAKVTVEGTVSSGTKVHTYGTGATRQDAWDDRASNSASDVFPNNLLQMWWEAASSGFPSFTESAYIRKDIQSREYLTAHLDGVLSEAYYEYVVIWGANFTPTTMDFFIGTESFTVTGSTSGKQATTDPTISADTYIDADITTTEPGTVPFSSSTGSSAGFRVNMTGIILHIDLATILADQA